MKIEFTKEEVTHLVEMLTIVGYVTTQASEATIKKSENMHDLIQKIYRSAQASDLPDGFEAEEETQMIFPNAQLMTGGEDSPLYLLKTYNEYAAAEVLSQHLSIRDAASSHGELEENADGELDPAFIEAFSKQQTIYLEEFSENGFDNVRVETAK